ncbi:MAG: PKD domain-containing protein, partial [Anaerolineaceae bacterium]
MNVQFTNLSTGNITSTEWSFGDGATSNQQNPSHTFNSPGTFPVTLTISGPGGTSNVTRQVIVQSANPPVASFTQDAVEGTAPLTVNFTDTSSGGQIDQRIWSFGDGRTETITDGQRNISHTYENVGTYNVILSVEGPGGTSSSTRQIRVGNPVSVDIVGSVSDENPLEVGLQAQASGGSQNYVAYDWDFGDGQTQANGNASTSVTYQSGGTYTINVTVRDSQGNTGQGSAIVTVIEPDALVAAIDVQQTSPTNLEVGLAGSASGGVEPYSFLWTFDDGTTAEGQSLNRNYTAPGQYLVRLTVTDSLSVAAQAEVTVTIEEEVVVDPLSAAIDVQQTSPTSLEVGLAGSASGGVEPYSFLWTFDDGTTAEDQSLNRTYPGAGQYPVSLTVTDS